jgi:hyaluronoglucosaminidase
VSRAGAGNGLVVNGQQGRGAVRGVIEGFYGVHYTHPERLDLIQVCGSMGFTHYLYAPKNDRQHRVRWWEPYPERMMARFGELVVVGRASGIEFCYAISPGGSIAYSSAGDFQRLVEKLAAFYQRGVRIFSLLLDDIDPELNCPEDRAHYRDYAVAQADLSNRVYAWLNQLDPACSLSMCPTDYWGRPPLSPYLQELGSSLHPEIGIFYTGPQICSAQIGAEDARSFAAFVRRKPLIWDNYPVNDLDMQPELHLGPLRGREPGLLEQVDGFYVNLMLQAEASKIPLFTCAAFLADPYGYNPQAAWAEALLNAAGPENFAQLHLLAENSLDSPLGAPEADRLACLAAAAMQALECGERPPASLALVELDAYLQSLDEACYALRYRLENLPLRANLLPWIELMDHWQDMGRRALRVIEYADVGLPYEIDLRFMREFMTSAQRHPKRIMGAHLLPLAQFALEQINRKILEVLE